jgi:hypothetical protein
MNFRSAIVAGGMLILATAANADVVTITITGTLDSFVGHDSIDQLGMFGAVNANLDGDAFTIVSTLNNDIGHIVTSPGDTRITGGTNVLYPTPSISNVVTVNGTSVTIDGSFIAAYELFQTGSISGLEDYVEDNNGTSIGQVMIDNLIVKTPALPGNFSTDFTYNLVPGDSCSGCEIEFDQIPTSGPELTTHGYLDVSSVSVSVSGAPEPTTWAMFLLGFGAVGGTLRKVRRMATARESST